MSTKFLGTTTVNANLTDGSASLYINNLGCANLSGNLPVKTNGIKQLISSKLEINDVNNLQTALDSVSTSNLTSAGGTTLVNDGIGPDLAIKGLQAGTNITLSSDANSITINSTLTSLTSAGVNTLITDGTGPDLAIKGLQAGTNITLSSDANNITINSTNPTIQSLAGTQTIVNDGTGPLFVLKGLTQGTGITITDQSLALTINATPPTLSSAGGTESLVNDGTGLDLAIKGLSAGSDMSLTSDVNSVTINYNDTRLLVVEDKTQNINSVNTIAENTEITGFVTLTNPDLKTFEPVPDIGTLYNDLNNATNDSYGMRFTVTDTITIVQVGIPFPHWTGNITTAVNFKFYEEGNILPIGEYVITKSTTQGNFYVELLGSPLVLNAGTYRMSCGYKADMDVNGVLLAPMVFPSQIINVEGASTTDPDGAYPTTIAIGQSLTRAGVFYYNYQDVATLTSDKIVTNTIDSNNTEVDVVKTINMNGFSILNCQNINNIRPSGGVYSQSYLIPIVGIQTDLNLIGLGNQFGTATIPANGFVAGDTFALKIGGSITCANGDIFTLVLRTNTSIFATFNITIDGALVAGFWEAEAEFMIPTIGTAGVASVVTNGNVNYVNSVMFLKGIGVNRVEAVNFDTTVSNTLQILYSTAEASITSFIPTQISITKLF